nr:hypothetical protein [Candidatus Sigynarchaeota archaeon]
MLNIKDATPEGGSQQSASPNDTKIKVKAMLLCPSCGYKKVFKNQFDRKHLDQLVVSAKVMAWAACDCGDLIEFSLELEI